MTTPRQRPLGYARLWSSGPDKPMHSREFFWADARAYVGLDCSMFDKYGYEGKPITREDNGQWVRVVPLYERSGKKGKR